MKLIKSWPGRLLILFFLVIAVPLSVTMLQRHSVKVRATIGGMPYVHGNQLYDGLGNPLILRGAHIESTLVAIPPYSLPTEILAEQHLTSATFDVMRNSWNMNVVRIATSDYEWRAHKAAYIAKLKSVVAEANQAGLYVVLSLHEDIKGGDTYGENANHLPTPLSLTYWPLIARTFKSNPMVMFDIYNEPNLQGITAKQLTDADWQLWLHGGKIGSIVVHGMQELVDAIRQTGAKQVLIVEALDNSFETIAKDSNQNFVNDSNIVYSTHIYFQDQIRDPAGWDLATGALYKQFPMIIGEWAFEPNAGYTIRCDNLNIPNDAINLVKSFLQYMQQNNISWAAFAFTLKQLIQDYVHYTPTQLTVPPGLPPWNCALPTPIVGMGAIVQQYLLAHPPG
jgi:Cellulase (glycosyl hydrolase family 5)